LERRTSAPRRGESNNNILVLSDLLREARVVQENDLARQLALDLGLDRRLLIDELGQALEIAAAAVVGGLIALAVEPLQCREPRDAVLLAERLMLVGIDLGDCDLARGMLEARGELLVYGSEVLAVPAPRREELDERGLARVEHDVVEVGGREVDYGVGGCEGREGRGY